MNLGRHVSEEAAAKAYDKAAICARGKEFAKLNFSFDDYSDELEQLQKITVAELAPVLRCCYQQLAWTLSYTINASVILPGLEHEHAFEGLWRSSFCR